MAAVADKVVVELELRDGQYLSRVRQNERVFSQSQQRVGDSAEQAERRIRASSAGISAALRRMAVTLAAGVSVTAVTRLADEYTQLQNRLRVTGIDGEALLAVQDRLFAAANRNGVEVGALAQVYARASLAANELGASQGDLLQFTDNLSNAVRVQGTSTAQARGALLQLSQALGSSIVRGEEFNSILEGLPIIAQTVAANIDRFGGSVSKLRTEIVNGKVTSQEFFEAFLRGSQRLEEQAAQANLTIGQSFTVLANELSRYIGQTDQSLSASQRLSAGIIGLADNLDRVVPAIAAITGLFAARYVASLTAAGLAEDGFITKARQATAEAIANERAKTAAVAAGARARTMALTAESIALRRQVDTGRNATGQFISRAAAQRQLSEANRALAASMLPATVATARNTRVVTAATVGVRAFGSGLLSLAGGPIGVTILAVGALAFAVSRLIQENTDAAISARALQEAEERAAPAKTQLEKLTRELASASRDRAAAIREEINELINLQRVEAARAREAYNQAKQQARGSGGQSGEGVIAAFGGDPSSPAAREAARQINELNEAAGRAEAVMYEGLDIGAAPNTRAVREARAEYEATLSVVTAMEEALQEAESAQRSLNTAAADDKGAAKRAREALQRARMLEDLQAEVELEEARSDEDEARIRRLEREAEIRSRLRSLIDGGFSEGDAGRISGEVQARLDAARERVLQRQNELMADGINLRVAEIDEDAEIIRMLQRQNELRELQVEFGKILNDQESARQAAIAAQAELEAARVRAAGRYLGISRAEHAIRVAESSGNERLLNQLRDAEEIRRRTLEYQRQGLLTEEQSRYRASLEVTREREAATYGEQRELFTRAFSDGIRAALEGDIGGFVTSQIGSFADRALERLGEQIYDQIFGGVDAVAEGTAQGTAQGAAVSVAMVGAATTSGAIIATAMVTAGASVAGAIAAAMATSSGAGNVGRLLSSLPFGGFRAGGGPVRAGFAYDVGENGRERFIAPANGFIAPNTESVSASPSGGGMAFTFAPVYQVQGYGQDIERLKQQMAADQASFSNRVAGAVTDGYRRGKVRLARG